MGDDAMSRSGIEARISETIRQYELYRENDWAYSCAVSLSDLIEARDRGLIEQAGVDVEESLSYVASRRTSVERQWGDKLRQLHRVSSSRGEMEWEEVVLVLSLRSGLEAASRFLDGESRRRLREEIDPLLSKSLEKNRASVAGLRSRGSADLACELPSHWWWREE
jgi:hypothetical protein